MTERRERGITWLWMGAVGFAAAVWLGLRGLHFWERLPFICAAQFTVLYLRGQP